MPLNLHLFKWVLLGFAIAPNSPTRSFCQKRDLEEARLTTFGAKHRGHTIWRVLEGLALNRLSPNKAREYMPGRAASETRALLLSE
jgi:hypothetical protein